MRGAGWCDAAPTLRHRLAPASAYAFRAFAAVLLLLDCLLCRLTAGHTEALVVDAERRVFEVACRRPADVRVAPPAAAAARATEAPFGADRIGAA